MTGSGKVDILLLRDAARVRRYRVPVFLLRLVWLSPLVLLLLLAAAVMVASHLRRDNLALAKQQTAMRAELDTAGERLIRLENIEKILRSGDVTALETLIGSYNADNPGWWKPRTAETNTKDAKDAKGDRERDAARVDLSKLLSRVDANQAGIDNLRVKFENKKLSLGFDLSNVTPQTSLVGRVEAALVGNDASLLPLKADNDALSFQIQRFKQIAVNLPLPPKLEAKDVYGLRLAVVDPSGKTVFARVYPLSKD